MPSWLLMGGTHDGEWHEFPAGRALQLLARSAETCVSAYLDINSEKAVSSVEIELYTPRQFYSRSVPSAMLLVKSDIPDGEIMPRLFAGYRANSGGVFNK